MPYRLLKRTPAFITCCIAALIFITQSSAAKDNGFSKYLQSTPYTDKLLETAVSYAIKQKACAHKQTLMRRSAIKILETPKFKTKKRHPYTGTWFETVHIVVCKHAYSLDITAISNKKSSAPDMSAAPTRKKRTQTF